jgi:hypothetical protein
MLLYVRVKSKFFNKLQRKKQNLLGKNCYIDQLSDELLEEIFRYLSYDDLCNNLNHVSKRWRNLIESDSFWIKKCISEDKIDRRSTRILNDKRIDWSPKQIYSTSLLSKNFIKNSNGDESFNNWSFCYYGMLNSLKTPDSFKKAVRFYKKHRTNNLKLRSWEIEWSNSSNGWAIEKNQTAACEKLRDTRRGELFTCFVTSYTLGEKMQVIDLEEENITEDMLIKLNPIVQIREVFTARENIKCFYCLKVYLISKEFDLIDSYSYSDRITEFPASWITVSHQFKINSRKNTNNLRYILFYHSGKV